MKIIFNPFTGSPDFVGDGIGAIDWTLGYPTYDARYIQSANVTNGLSYSASNIELGGILTKNTIIDGGGLHRFGLGQNLSNGFIPISQNYIQEKIDYYGISYPFSVGYFSTKNPSGEFNVYNNGAGVSSVREITSGGHYLYYNNSVVEGSFSITQDAVTLNHDLGIRIASNSLGNIYGYLKTDNLTSNRTYQFPDASGTFLLDTTYPALLDGTYARLDGSNMPFTGGVVSNKSTSGFGINVNLLTARVSTILQNNVNAYSGINITQNGNPGITLNNTITAPSNGDVGVWQNLNISSGSNIRFFTNTFSTSINTPVISLYDNGIYTYTNSVTNGRIKDLIYLSTRNASNIEVWGLAQKYWSFYQYTTGQYELTYSFSRGVWNGSNYYNEDPTVRIHTKGQMSLWIKNGLKLGNNTDTASTAGFGSIKALTNQYYGVVPNTTTPTWEKFAFVGMDKNITLVNTGTYAILSTDNIIDITVTCSATLPTITADLVGKAYRIFAQNVPVTVNASGGDLIDGIASANLVGYSMITVRALKLGVWRIGD